MYAAGGSDAWTKSRNEENDVRRGDSLALASPARGPHLGDRDGRRWSSDRDPPEGVVLPPLQLYDGTYRTGAEVFIYTRGPRINLSTVSFSNGTSSFKVGACAVKLASGRGGKRRALHAVPAGGICARRHSSRIFVGLRQPLRGDGSLGPPAPIWPPRCSPTKRANPTRHSPTGGARRAGETRRLTGPPTRATDLVPRRHPPLLVGPRPCGRAFRLALH